MKKRNLIKVLGAMVVLAAIGVGSTLAYLSDRTGTLHNTFSIGDVSIALKESAVESCEWGFKDKDGANTWTVDFSQGENGIIKDGVKYEGIVAGEYIYKDPTVFPVASVHACIYVHLGNCEVVDEQNGIIRTKVIDATDKSLEFKLCDNWYIINKNANGGIIIEDFGGGWGEYYDQGTSMAIFKELKDDATGAVYTTKLPDNFEEDSTFQDLTVQAMIIQGEHIYNNEDIALIKANTDWLND
ncbi:SipW-cognate class signal peptide [Acetitomaculum ruminis DSM 5522]|uniref:SipW-cognate class signal peptide n=1 Tax=Acetitomaculum ruminis DSM 5522 TaxID=1120918 RepID=A0A1I0XSM1_9FIRM|nr:SipW-dependent-type signal peptide-containing protein [Acetitomaculum ruminis]SFB02993.1 SipW-cognate class signal peptide [Acetitomaculum ruminis DSM 5522]